MIDINGADSSLYNNTTGAFIAKGITPQDDKTAIWTVDPSGKGFDKDNPWKTAEKLMYNVGEKQKTNVGKSNLRDNHPLAGKGWTFGSQVFEEDLLDMTTEFNNILNNGNADFSVVRYASEKTAYIWGMKTTIKFEEFYDLVQTDNKYDLKSRITNDGTASYAAVVIGEWSIYNGQLMNYDDYGNISYGYFGRLSKISAQDLFYYADYAQLRTSGHRDPPRDRAMIGQGIILHGKNGEKAFTKWLLGPKK